MYTFSIHPAGVVVAAIASMLLGMLWYSPFLFGPAWMKLVGITPEAVIAVKEDSEAKKKMWLGYLGTFLFSLVAAYVMGLFIKNMFVPGITDAIKIGLCAWLGFVAPSMSREYLFAAKPKPWSLYAINAGYWLVSLLFISAIIFFFV